MTEDKNSSLLSVMEKLSFKAVPDEGEPETPKKPQKGPSRRCRHWARGECKMAERCTFLHSGVAGVHLPCRHFMRGSCGRADLCDFKHEHVNGYRVGYMNSPPLGVAPVPMMGYPGGLPGGMLPQFPILSPIMMPSSRMSPPMNTVSLNLNPGYNNGPVSPLAYGPPMMHMMSPISVVGLPQPRVVTPPSPLAMSPLSPPQQRISSSRCRHWENGSCRLGNACTFRHDPEVPQKYRTKVCRHWEKGNCRVAENCSFAHPEKQ
jgi:hypothetical protein